MGTYVETQSSRRQDELFAFELNNSYHKLNNCIVIAPLHDIFGVVVKTD